MKECGYGVKLTKAGLGFIPVTPIKILGKGKDKKGSTQHISVNVMEDKEESKLVP